MSSKERKWWWVMNHYFFCFKFKTFYLEKEIKGTWLNCAIVTNASSLA